MTQHYSTYKNLLILSLTFFLVYSSTLPIINLQSSLYHKAGLGYVSLSFLYLGQALGSLYLPIILIEKFNTKVTIIISICPFFLYAASILHGTWLTLLPASLLFGLGSGVIWPAAQIYVRDLAKRHAILTEQNEGVVFARFYPTLFSFFKLSQILSNIVSSNVLLIKRMKHYSHGSAKCGSGFCPNMKLPDENISVTFIQLLTLGGISLGLALIGILLLTCFLDNTLTEPIEARNKGVCKFIPPSFREMKDMRMVLLTPIFLFSGLQCGFMYADFTKAYVTCYVGMDMIGFSMCVFGIASFLTSIMCSISGKYLSPSNLLTGVVFIYLGFLLLMLKWNGNKVHHMYPYFIMAFLGGLCDTVWRSQLPVLVADIFKSKHRELFSLLMFWQSLGYVLSFCLGLFICVSTKIFVITAFMLCGVVLGGCAQYAHAQNEKKDERMG